MAESDEYGSNTQTSTTQLPREEGAIGMEEAVIDERLTGEIKGWAHYGYSKLKRGYHFVTDKIGVYGPNMSNDPITEDLKDFTIQLKNCLTMEIVHKLMEILHFTDGVSDSTNDITTFVQSLIKNKVISNDSISILLDACNAIKRPDVAKDVRTSFEGFEREATTDGSCGKPLYSYDESQIVGGQQIRVLQHHERVLDKRQKIRICHIGRRTCSGGELKVILMFGQSGSGTVGLVRSYAEHHGPVERHRLLPCQRRGFIGTTRR